MDILLLADYKDNPRLWFQTITLFIRGLIGIVCNWLRIICNR